MKLEKALYGTLQASLIFWKKLTATLIDWGFEINPYDWCVANKTVNGEQLTIVWNVEDIKISHIEANLVTDIISEVNKKYCL